MSENRIWMRGGNVSRQHGPCTCNEENTRTKSNLNFSIIQGCK